MQDIGKIVGCHGVRVPHLDEAGEARIYRLVFVHVVFQRKAPQENWQHLRGRHGCERGCHHSSHRRRRVVDHSRMERRVHLEERVKVLQQREVMRRNRLWGGQCHHTAAERRVPSNASRVVLQASDHHRQERRDEGRRVRFDMLKDLSEHAHCHGPVAAWSARLRKFEHGINELREMSLRDCHAARLREGTYEVGNIVHKNIVVVVVFVSLESLFTRRSTIEVHVRPKLARGLLVQEL
mmetsp:Transcript_58623/g.162299  ORF Transcript_58623/g.162299 Transcript_58623/m.162299 type:complete len:238 (+) Transcript_58623:431-1144(+)